MKETFLFKISFFLFRDNDGFFVGLKPDSSDKVSMIEVKITFDLRMGGGGCRIGHSGAGFYYFLFQFV